MNPFEQLSPRQVNLAFLIILIGLVAWVYHPTLQNGFHFDDRPNIIEAYQLHLSELSIEEVAQALESAVLPRRLIPNLTFIIDWWRGGGSARSFQQTNYMLHLINTGLVFLLMPLLLRPLFQGSHQLRLALISAVVAALWALHPIQIQGVTYIVQRMNELAVLFMLLSSYGYLRARQSIGNGRWVWLGVTGLSALAGALSKENAWVIPGIWWLLEYGVVRHGQPLIKYPMDRLMLALPIVVALAVILDLILEGPLTSLVIAAYEPRDFTMEQRLLTQPRVLLFHLLQIVFPWPDRFSIIHEPLVSTSLFDPRSTLPALFLVVIWIIAGFWLLFRLRARVMGALLLWMPLTLVIESSFWPLEMVFEHRMYLPTVGLAGLLATLLLSGGNFWGWQRRILIAVIIFTIIPFLIWATDIRLSDWRNQETLYRSAVQSRPNSLRANFNLANVLQSQGNDQEAIQYYQRALEMDPGNADVYTNLASIMVKKQQYDEARRYYQSALRHDPMHYKSIGGYANLERKLGNESLAEQLFLRAIETDPLKEVAYIHLSWLYIESDRQPLAVQMLRNGVERSQGNPLVINELGVVLAQGGQLQEARQQFVRSVRAYPGYADAYSNLGGVLLQLGEVEQGRLMLKKALGLNPEHLQARQNLRLIE